MARGLLGLTGFAATTELAPVAPTTSNAMNARTERITDVARMVIALPRVIRLRGGTPELGMPPATIV